MNRESEKGHSEEYFSEYRDHWWNSDFLELMANRWRLGSYSSLLDVGCGEFHWSKLLAPHMSSPKITGLDSDPKWATSDILKIRQNFPNAINVEVVSGSADSIPLPDNSFDVVTCQTLLIHLPDPEKTIAEMKRVTKPGGIVICVEPNNMAPFLSIDSLDSVHEISKTLDAAKMYLYQQYGKYIEGLGYNSMGDLVPLFLHEAGLENIRTYLSDKCLPLIPPYNTKEQVDTINSITDWIEREEAEFNSVEVQALVEKAERVLGDIGINVVEEMNRNMRKTKASLESGSLYSPGSTTMYLVSGTKL